MTFQVNTDVSLYCTLMSHPLSLQHKSKPITLRGPFDNGKRKICMNIDAEEIKRRKEVAKASWG